MQKSSIFMQTHWHYINLYNITIQKNSIIEISLKHLTYRKNIIDM